MPATFVCLPSTLVIALLISAAPHSEFVSPSPFFVEWPHCWPRWRNLDPLEDRETHPRLHIVSTFRVELHISDRFLTVATKLQPVTNRYRSPTGRSDQAIILFFSDRDRPTRRPHSKKTRSNWPFERGVVATICYSVRGDLRLVRQRSNTFLCFRRWVLPGLVVPSRRQPQLGERWICNFVVGQTVIA